MSATGPGEAEAGELAIVGAESLDDLAALERLAEAVFGTGQRERGWFRRKLIREGVAASLSSVAVVGPVNGANVHGYVLLGRAPSREAIARGAGVAVAETLRHRGVGRTLLEHAISRAGAAGCAAVEFLAEPARLAWYTAQGFAVIEEQLTLAALGTGEPAGDRIGQTADTLLGSNAGPARGEALWSWITEVWDRTPAHERVFVQLDGVRFWISREGRAWLVHRCELERDPAALERDPAALDSDSAALERGIAALRRRLAPTTPLLLYPCPTTHAWVDTLRRAGFEAAQRSFVVRRTTDSSH